MCGLDIAPVSYIGGAVGGGAATPDYSVATFSLLPSDATAGQRCAVTAESGLSGVVVVNTAANTWELETVSLSSTALAAVAWGTVQGRWYSAGGITVTTATGAVARDTTAGRLLMWWPTTDLGATGFFIPPEVYQRTPVLRGWHIGTEAGAARAAQGYTEALVGNGAITGDYAGGGEIRLYGGLFAGTATAQMYCGGTTTSGLGVYTRTMARGATAAASGSAEAALRVAADGTNFNWLQQRDSLNVRLTDSANSPQDGTSILDGDGSRFNGVASAHEEWEVLDYGRAVTTRVMRNGLPYTAGRRNLATSVTTAPVRYAVGGTTTGSEGDLRIKQGFTVTFTP